MKAHVCHMKAHVCHMKAHVCHMKAHVCHMKAHVCHMHKFYRSTALQKKSNTVKLHGQSVPALLYSMYV